MTPQVTTLSSGIRQVTWPTIPPTGTVDKATADAILQTRSVPDTNSPAAPTIVLPVAERPVAIPVPGADPVPATAAVVTTGSSGLSDWIKSNPGASIVVSIGIAYLLYKMAK